MNLFSPTSSAAIASYISQFLKHIRSCSSTLPELDKMKFFINGIRPDKLRFVIRSDSPASVSSFPLIIFRIPLTTFFIIKLLLLLALNPLADPSPLVQLLASPSPLPSISLPLTSKLFPHNLLDPPRNTFLLTSPFLPLPDFIYCPKPGCKVSKAPRKYGNSPTIHRKHNFRSSVNQVVHEKAAEPKQVNSIIQDIQAALEEDTIIEETSATPLQVVILILVVLF
ncbi:hypothetical protein P9112_002195 [Eukaryota sp. TZLM1-RC]